MRCINCGKKREKYFHCNVKKKGREGIKKDRLKKRYFTALPHREKAHNLQKSELLAEQALLKSLSEGRLEILDDLYYRYRDGFLRWAGRRFGTTPNDLEDAWQDAVIALYERAISPKPFELRCSLRTYLYAIGGKRLLQNHRKMQRFIWKDDIDRALHREAEVLTFEWDDPRVEDREHLLACIERLGPQCRELLLCRYYDGKELEDLQHQFQYQNLNTVSASISRCIKQLKTLVEEKRTV